MDIDDPVLNHSTPAGVRYNANRRLFVESFDPATDMDVRAPLRNVTNSCISTQPCSSSSILEELKKVTSRLDTLSEHMESLGGRIKSLEQTQTAFSTPCSSSDGSAVKGKRKVPAKVSVRICLYFSFFSVVIMQLSMLCPTPHVGDRVGLVGDSQRKCAPGVGL